MALGKNIKKQQLIPGSDNSASNKKTKSKSSGSKENATSKKAISKKPAATKKPVKKATAPKVQAKSRSTAKKSSGKQSKEFIERKSRVNTKFKEEFAKIRERRLHLIVFRLGTQEYALEIDQTKEVVVTPEISDVPHMPFYVRGLVNIRENVIVAIDLEKKYGLRKSEDEKSRYIIVIKSDDYNVGILSREVPTTLIIDGKNLSSPSGYMSDASIDISYIKGIVRDENRLIYLIDIEELIRGDNVGAVADMENILN